jgi:hypothetical protein
VELDLALLVEAGVLALALDGEDWRSASRLRVRMRMIESCSMSLRSLRRDSMSSISLVRPSASKRLDGLK